ncbi:MAG TPA: carbohydrate ABC transporter permease [Firmicutes bacterium]|nr:carbohydrate ABC transporter permease [Bacillota bacterium]
MLATRRSSFLSIGLITLAATALGVFFLAVASYYRDKVSFQTKKNLGKLRVVLQYLAAIGITAIMLFPIYWMVISSLKTSTELLLPVPTLWPRDFQWQNFPNVLNRAPFVRYLFNTLVSTFFVMLGELVFGILAAYGFAKGKFKGQNVLFLLVLGALMVPIQVTFVPIYVMISRLGWINSFPGLIVPNLVSAYFIFMLRQAFKAVDESYLDAGRVDGLGRIGLIWNVLIPMTKPTLITISIITFINGWNNYFWPKMVATRDEYRTIAVGVTRLRQTFAGMEVANYNEIMAGAVMAIIPIILLFLVLQKYIMTGMSKAAMK